MDHWPVTWPNLSDLIGWGQHISSTSLQSTKNVWTGGRQVVGLFIGRLDTLKEWQCNQTKAVGTQNMQVIFDILWCVGHITPSTLSFSVTPLHAHRLTCGIPGDQWCHRCIFLWSQTHWRIFVKWHHITLKIISSELCPLQAWIWKN